MKPLFASISFLIALFCCINMAYSQSSKPRIGIQAGVAFANMTAKFDDLKETYGIRTGFTVGVVANFEKSAHFAIQPALNFTQKGSKESNEDVTETVTVNYFELPVNFLYKTSDAGKGHFFVGGGPVLGFAFNGKYKFEYGGSESDGEDLKIGFADDQDLMPLDLSVNILAGYQFSNGLFFAANYTPGLLNIDPVPDDEVSLKSSYFGIRLGFMLGGKKSNTK